MSGSHPIYATRPQVPEGQVALPLPAIQRLDIYVDPRHLMSQPGLAVCAEEAAFIGDAIERTVIRSFDHMLVGLTQHAEIHCHRQPCEGLPIFVNVRVDAAYGIPPDDLQSLGQTCTTIVHGVVHHALEMTRMVHRNGGQRPPENRAARRRRARGH